MAFVRAHFLALPVVALALSAQTSPPAKPRTGDEVVVVGERLTPQERRDRAVAYVRDTGIAAGDQPTARWIVPICLKVVGLPPAAAETVAARIRAIAIDSGARLAKPGCRTNAMVAFTDNGPAVMREISAKRSSSLQEVTPSVRKALVEGDDPARWWYSTREQGKDGDAPEGSQAATISGESNKDSAGSSSAASGGQTLPGNMDTNFQSVRNMSLISTQVVRGIHAANVVIDIKRLNGVGLEEATDFAGFVTLAEVRPRRLSQPDSILGLFTDPNASGRRLTEWDEALLRGLYQIKLDRVARAQRGALTAAILDPKKRR